MATLPESAEFTPGIYQLEETDPVVGGPDGVDNLQAKQLANRTLWLKQEVETLQQDLGSIDAYTRAEVDTLVGQSLTQAQGDERYLLKSNFIVGQCVLIKDGSNLVLKPFNGNRITINGEVETIPDAGVSASPSGLVANNTYYIYVRMNAGVMALDFADASTTTHSTQPDTGVEIKDGDPTRTLVGIARTNASIAWEDSETKRLVRSWFNRESAQMINKFNSTKTTVSLVPVELSSSEGRIDLVCWEGETLVVATGGSMNNLHPGGVGAVIGVGIDSTTVSEGVNGYGIYGGGIITIPMSTTVTKKMDEGHHYATALGWTTNGQYTTYYFGSANDNDHTRSGISGFII